MRTPVMPITPPLAASALMASSVFRRGWLLSARQFECVIAIGFGRQLDRLERGAVAAVRDVDQHAGLVHRLDDLDAVVGDAAVDALGRAAADQVLRVVGELRAAQAQVVEVLHVLGAAELVGVLQAHDDGDLARGLGAVDVLGAADQREHLAVAPGETAPRGDELQRLGIGFRAADADRIVERGDARGAEHVRLGIGQRQRERVRIEVDLERRQHVDDERALHDVDDFLRIRRERVCCALRSGEPGRHPHGGGGTRQSAQ
jgi:hypothetical protein